MSSGAGPDRAMTATSTCNMSFAALTDKACPDFVVRTATAILTAAFRVVRQEPSRGRCPEPICLDLCRSIKNPALNGNRKPADLIDHTKTALVVWASEPGGRRTKPPLSYDQFMSSFREWVAPGASCEN